eukprot:TRINITY_DN8861_c0_g1_i1.p1 TRINITY_DN8861_c0_g1~~TRINITY_DN8861_c0_g1_i1.p1  ORF type:complete len:183 (-),score=76.23 TRINITY_DN8861_c0_g1_i1:131-679(-)
MCIRDRYQRRVHGDIFNQQISNHKMAEIETFEQADSGASLTYPLSIGSLKKGDYALLKGKPCKIMEINVSKTGKHGHAKATIVGVDIFTGKKYEDGGPTSHNVDAPNVKKIEYTLIDIDEDGFVSVMDEKGGLKNDLKLDLDDDNEITKKIKEAFADGKEVLVQVTSAMGEEHITAYRETNA